MLNQQQGFGAFPNGALGMSNSFSGTSGVAQGSEDTFPGFGGSETKTKEKESGGFSLFGLFAKPKQESLNDMVPDNPWLDNRFFRDTTPEEEVVPQSSGTVVDQFNMAYRTLI